MARRWELGLWALCAACVFPLWYVDYPPIQDLPQHLAAVRVLHDYDDPAFGFARFFELDLWRTQYLAYYAAADLLAYPFGVELANRLLITAVLVATPWSMRALLLALGKDWRLCVLSLPLVYNAHLTLGFLNFLAAIPLAFYGLALAVRERRAPTPARAWALAVLLIVCFYTHVVPFALMALGVGLCALQRDLRRLARSLLPLVPASAALALWLLRAPAGRATLTAAAGSESGPVPQFQSVDAALRDLPRWMTDVLAGDADRLLLLAWAGLLAASLLAGLAALIWRGRAEAPDRLGRSLVLRLSLLSPLCAVAYFVAPTSYDWIWPIAQRFPLLSALFAVIALPALPRAFGHAAVVAGALLSLAHFHYTGDAWTHFDREEVGDFERALAEIPEGQRVVGLIFTNGSRNVAFSPFIHYVAYYQARKGGAVMFTFADFPQSPFRFRADQRPPRVRPRWEWLPAQVRPARDLGWYDFALVRGGPGSIARPDSGFAPRYRGSRWSVFARPGAGSPR